MKATRSSRFWLRSMLPCRLCDVLWGKVVEHGQSLWKFGSCERSRLDPAHGEPCGRPASTAHSVPFTFSADIGNNDALIWCSANGCWLALIFQASNTSLASSQGCCAFSLRSLCFIFPFVLQAHASPHPVSSPERLRMTNGTHWIIWRNLWHVLMMLNHSKS